MRARQYREADDMNALLEGGLDDLLGRQADAVVDDFEAAIGGAHGDLLGAVGMAVEAGLADEELGLSCRACGASAVDR